MGKAQRDKGQRIEREIVHLHQDAGIPAERVPLSGAAGGSFTGDLLIADTLRAEVKARAGGGGFKTLERWLGKNDLLFLRKDGITVPYVIMSWKVYVALMTGQRDEGNDQATDEAATSDLQEEWTQVLLPFRDTGEQPCDSGSQEYWC